MKAISCLLILSGLSCVHYAFAAAKPVTFRLHKFQQPIGTETDTFSNRGQNWQMDAAFEFTDRGTKVPLKATLRCSRASVPSYFSESGSTSRSSTVDVDVTINGNSAKIRDGKDSRDVAIPQRFFSISGYAPAGMQAALLHYWLKHGRPAQLATVPAGTVHISDRGQDIFIIGARRVALRRYSVSGLVWGLETLWLDRKGNLVALVTRDAEFDHFEAVEQTYESALADFVSSAARDEIANLAEIAKTLEGRQTGTLAITGATLINGTGAPPISPATVIVSDGKIAAAGAASSTAIPATAKCIDATGKYIIPGLWDMHAHYEQVEWGPIYLAAGVTTVRDVGNEFDFITAIRDANNSGAGLGPRLVLAGVVDGDGPMSLGIQRVNSAADAAWWVKKYHDAGFQQIKIYSSVKPEVVKAICQEAHTLGMTVTGHIPFNMSIFDGIQDGMDQVNHISYLTTVALWPKDSKPRQATAEQRIEMLKKFDVNSEPMQSLIAALKQHGTVIDDTAATFELLGQAAGEENTAEPGIQNVAPELQEQFRNSGVSAERLPLTRLQWNKTLELMGALHRAGIRFVAGTDQAVPGYSVYREIELYVQAGFTPMEALQAATLVPAQVMKLDAESGTVAAGKRADLDVLDANPLEDIRNVRSVHWVVANGTLFDPKPLWKSVGFKVQAAK